MSDFFRSAARCDISVVRRSPLPLNEKAIIEEEIIARQWDTLSEKVAIEKELRQQIKSAELEQLRQREQEERVRKLRLDEKRKQAIQTKELDREARQEMDKLRREDLEMKRLAEVEEARWNMEADREAARNKAAEKAYEDVQKRLRKALEPSEQYNREIPDSCDLGYMERLEVEKARLARFHHLYPGQGIGSMYAGAQPPKALPKTQLEQDIIENRNRQRDRLYQQLEELRREEELLHAEESQKKLQTATEAMAAHNEWLRQKEEEESDKKARVAYKQVAEKPKEKHIIDVLHERVREQFLREQEAEALVEATLRDGASHLSRLEQYLDAEREAWRDHRQMEKEVEREKSMLPLL